MDWMSYVYPLVGGGLIGISVSVMLLANGRITGISGITNGLMTVRKGDMLWRATFVVGLILGGVILKLVGFDGFGEIAGMPLAQIAVAGLLVGFGTVMGSGCTSGHGICGMARLSPRSILATLTFMFFGFITVYIVNHVVGG